MHPFLNIQPGKRYSAIMLDPPWPVTHKANGKHKAPPYALMPIAEIAALPIPEIAASDCKLFLWTTNAMLPEAIAMIRLWRFQYKMAYTWCKSYGMGRSPLVATEHCLIATIGQPPTPLMKGKALFNHRLTTGKLRHSEKPDECIADIEKIAGSGLKIELFARKRRPGWDAWGNELQPSVN